MISPVDPVGVNIVETLAALGYDYLELSLRDLAALSEPAFAAVAGRLSRTGLSCEACNNFFPPTIRLTGPEASLSAALAYARGALDRAARLGVAVVVFGSSGARNVPANFPLGDAWVQLRELLGALAPMAAERGIVIAIEPLNRGESNILNLVAEGGRLAREVAHPAVRVLADAYHLLLEKENPAILGQVRDLAHVHVAEDAARLFPSGYDPVIAEFFRQLRAAGYVQRVSIEAYSRDFATDAARGLEVCRTLAGSPPRGS